MVTPPLVLAATFISVAVITTPVCVPALVKIKSPSSQKVILYLGSPASNSFRILLEGITLPHTIPYSWGRTVDTGLLEPSPLYAQLKLLSPLSKKEHSNTDSELYS